MGEFWKNILRGLKIWGITVLASATVAIVYGLAKWLFNNAVVSFILAVLTIPLYLYLVGLMAKKWLKAK